MINLLDTVSCGGYSFEAIIPNLVHSAVTLIKIFIPIILIIFGMLDMGKAVLSNDEKTMKESQNKLVKRILYAVLVFLIVSLVQIVFGIVGKADSGSGSTATSCINCFINGECSK